MTLIFNEQTKIQLDSYLNSPCQALLVVGHRGSGKSTTIEWLAANLLNINDSRLNSYPYIRKVVPDEKQTISIDQVRSLDHFLAHKVPLKSQKIKRVVLIDDSEHMTKEAQNALLKNLEEPPEYTAFILSATDLTKLLPTIRSRLQTIHLNRPQSKELEAYLKTVSADSIQLSRALSISGGLPGLAVAILTEQNDHRLVIAANTAREILSSNQYARLILVNRLSKDLTLTQEVLSILKQMATIALETASGSQARRWQQVLTTAYDTEAHLSVKANTKLSLTAFMLNLS